MRHTNLITGYLVDYHEHSNKWQLLDGESKVLVTKDSLRELREYAEAQEKHERKAKFTRQQAYYYPPNSYHHSDVPELATVTSRDIHTGEFWISIPSEVKDGTPRRLRVPPSHLHQYSPENGTKVEAVKQEVLLIELAQERRKTTLKGLEKFVPI